MSLSVLVSFIGFVYEFPISVFVSIYASFGYLDWDPFVQYRLLFAAFVIGICSLNVLVNLRGVFKTSELWIYLGVLFYIVLVVWLNRDEYGYASYTAAQDISAVEFWFPILFKYVFFFLLGLHLTYWYSYRFVLMLCLVIAAFGVMTNVDYEMLGIDRREYVDGADVGNYLFLGDAMSISSLLLLAFFKHPVARLFLFIATAVVLFFVGSRTSFIVFTFTVILYSLVSFNFRWVPAYIIVCLGLFAFVSSLDIASLADRNSRMINVFTDYEDDASVLGRKRFAERGWEDILQSPITGRFGGQRDSDIIGTKRGWKSYIHNVVSYWRQFGIVVFAAIMFIYARFAWRMFLELPNRHSSYYRMFFFISAFIVVESLFSRSFAFTATHMFFGLAIALLGRDHIRRGLQEAAVKDGRADMASLDADANGKSRRRRRKRRRRVQTKDL